AELVRVERAQQLVMNAGLDLEPPVAAGSGSDGGTCSHNLEDQVKRQKAKGKSQKCGGPRIVRPIHFCLLTFAFCLLIFLFHLAAPLAALAAPSFAPVALSTKARKTLSCSPAA